MPRCWQMVGAQRAAWVLLPQPLSYRVSDAVSAHVAPRKGGASVLAAAGVLGASETLAASFVLSHHARLRASAVSQRAAGVLVPRSLIYSASNAYRWAAGAEIQRTCFGANRGACNAWDTKQELAGVSS